MTKLINKIKDIVTKTDPNQILSINCDFSDMDCSTKYNYHQLVNYWKFLENSKTKDNNEVYLQYKKIKDFSTENINKNIGIFSLFYFKGSSNFLSVGKYQSDMFYLDLKCQEYQKILSNAIDFDNELYVLTYWIL